jgi:hypothetical protein
MARQRREGGVGLLNKKKFKKNLIQMVFSGSGAGKVREDISRTIVLELGV